MYYYSKRTRAAIPPPPFLTSSSIRARSSHERYLLDYSEKTEKENKYFEEREINEERVIREIKSKRKRERKKIINDNIYK